MVKAEQLGAGWAAKQEARRRGLIGAALPKYLATCRAAARVAGQALGVGWRVARTEQPACVDRRSNRPTAPVIPRLGLQALAGATMRSPRLRPAGSRPGRRGAPAVFFFRNRAHLGWI